MTYRWLFTRVLVRLDAERAHRAGLAGIRLLGRTGLVPARRRRRVRSARGVRSGNGAYGDTPPEVLAMGLRFPGYVGVAAGFDKNAEAIDGLAALGFAFVEVGTVTAQAQPGNPRPRLFRLAADRAVVNRMGFNNDGAAVVARRLAERMRRRAHPDVVVGVNIGRSKAVDEAAAIADYELSTRLLAPYADYLVVNVSSPNTPGLRDLQAVHRLGPLLAAVRAQADAATAERVPLLVKIAPDLADADVVAIAELAVELGLDGIVATNTTTSRAGLRTAPEQVAAVEPGGLSGAPLGDRSLEVLELLHARVGDRLTLISVGGVESADDVARRLAAGASLVQAYTAFVYEGPAWPARINAEVHQRSREWVQR